VQLDLRDQVINAFGAQKSAYAQACFAPRHAPPRAYSLELEIDATGVETKRSFTPGQGAEPQPELDACVRNLKVSPLKLKPPGKATTSRIETLLH
jgi:hypothetical protein